MAQTPFRVTCNSFAEVRQALQRILQNFEAFEESVEDIIGGTLTDSATIDFTYDDTAGTITAIVIDDSISNAKLSNMATQRIKGRDTAGTGDPEDLTPLQVAAMLHPMIMTRGSYGA